ncbi:MAG: pyridoxamine 5'-phosphate oxidase family protein [Candidatus Latescibacterota bacterium]|jgi:uncharacterized pyridoxamine 5'-phosphate oxidase family protein
MTLSDCVKFAVENPLCTVATVDGDQPRARVFSLWRANEGGFYFSTGTPKPVCRQLQANPKIEVCFYRPGAGPGDLGTMMRVAGCVEFVADARLKTELLTEWPFLREMGITGPDDPMLGLFRIGSGEIRYWTCPPGQREHVETVRF